MKKGKKLLAGCLMTIAVSAMMVGCGNNNDTTTGTEATTNNTNAVNDKNQNTTEKNTIQNDGAEEKNTNVKTTERNADGGALEEVGEGIGEAGDDIINGAADAVDRLTDDGIDSESNQTTNTGVE